MSGRAGTGVTRIGAGGGVSSATSSLVFKSILRNTAGDVGVTAAGGGGKDGEGDAGGLSKTAGGGVPGGVGGMSAKRKKRIISQLREWLYLHFQILIREMKIVTYKSCLLYTSPSPRDLSTSRMPSSA